MLLIYKEVNLIQYLKVEFKRAVFSENMLFAMLIVLIALIIPYYEGSKIPFPNEDGLNFFVRIGAFLPSSFLPLLAPILCCIPFSLSYIIDKESGFYNYICVRIGTKKYFSIKLMINTLVSGLVFLIPQLIMLMFLIITQGINDNNMEIVGAFSEVYYSSKISYVILLIFIQFIFGGIFSTLALGISAVVQNKYLTIILPFVYVLLSGTVFELIGLNDSFMLNVISLFDISYSASMTASNLIIYDLIIFGVGIILLKFFGEKKHYE